MTTKWRAWSPKSSWTWRRWCHYGSFWHTERALDGQTDVVHFMMWRSKKEAATKRAEVLQLGKSAPTTMSLTWWGGDGSGSTADRILLPSMSPRLWRLRTLKCPRNCIICNDMQKIFSKTVLYCLHMFGWKSKHTHSFHVFVINIFGKNIGWGLSKTKLYRNKLILNLLPLLRPNCFGSDFTL